MTTVERHRVEPKVSIGDVDPMSVNARRAHIALCRRLRGCTRAAGHDEDHGTRHVCAPDGIVEWVI